jgi:hypothetical protein
MHTEKQNMMDACPHSLERKRENNRTDETDEIVDALQTIVSDVDHYLTNWCRRLDQCVESKDPVTTPDAILQQRYNKFQNEKLRWERQRRLEQQQLQNQAKQLTEAWLRLEDEQRRFLQMKNPQRSNGSKRESTPAATITVGQDSASAAHNDSLACGETRPPRRLPSISSTTTTRDSAIRQFEQLQREIASNRPNVNRFREAQCLSSGERR